MKDLIRFAVGLSSTMDSPYVTPLAKNAFRGHLLRDVRSWLQDDNLAAVTSKRNTPLMLTDTALKGYWYAVTPFGLMCIDAAALKRVEPTAQITDLAMWTGAYIKPRTFVCRADVREFFAKLCVRHRRNAAAAYKAVHDKILSYVLDTIVHGRNSDKVRTYKRITTRTV